MREKLILLVEDNPDDEFLALRAFRKHRLEGQVTVARDGVEALEYIFKTGRFSDLSKPGLPALILLDLKLPRLDGLEVLRQLRASEATRYLPVVVLTSSGEVRDIQISYRFGANSYIRKPVDFNQFSAAIGQICHYWLILNEPAPNQGSPL